MLTAGSAIITQPDIDFPAATVAFLKANPHGKYGDFEIEWIVAAYAGVCEAAGVDVALVLTQLCEETGNLSSDWAAVPNRNPAGIGVTGEPGKGVKFPSWVDSVEAHVGRLLVYALPKGQGTPYQQHLIDVALYWRPLPDSYRGVAPTLDGLQEHWATSKTYTSSMLARANAIAAFATS